MRAEELIEIIQTALDRVRSDGCTGCAFYDRDEWEMPCCKCIKTSKDYWRAPIRED